MAPHRHPLDQGTADRLAAGSLGPDDAPPGFRRAAVLLQSAGSVPSLPPGAEGEPAVVAAMAEAVRQGLADGVTPPLARRRRMITRVLAGKAAGVLAALTLGAGAAGAATGTLPDSVQEKVANAAGHVGLNLPSPDHGVERITDGCVAAEDGSFAKNRGQYLKQERAKGEEALAAAKASRCGMPVTADEGDETETEEPESTENTENTTGADHSQAGQDHGKAGDKGKGAEKGQAGDTHGQAGQEHPKATDDNAGDDNSQPGQDHAEAGDDNSQGGKDHAEAGEDNSQSGQEHADEDAPPAHVEDDAGN